LGQRCAKRFDAFCRHPPLHSPPFECIYPRNDCTEPCSKEKTESMPAPTDDSAIFDRDLLLSCRRRAFARAERGADFLLQRIADGLADRVDAVECRFPVAGCLAGLTGSAAAAIARSRKADRIVRIERDRDFLQGPFPAIVGDEEILPLKPASADLVVSLMA